MSVHRWQQEYQGLKLAVYNELQRDPGLKLAMQRPGPWFASRVIYICLHRLHPPWAESYVANRTTYLRRRIAAARDVTGEKTE